MNTTLATGLFIPKAKVQEILVPGNGYPIGKISLNLSYGNEKNIIEVYYHKFTTSGLQVGSQLKNLYLIPVKIPGEFQFVFVRETGRMRMKHNPNRITKAEVKDGKFVKDFEKKKDDINGYILIDYFATSLNVKLVSNLIKDSNKLRNKTKISLLSVLNTDLKSKQIPLSIFESIDTTELKLAEKKFIIGTVIPSNFGMSPIPDVDINSDIIDLQAGKNLQETLDDIFEQVTPYPDGKVWPIANAGPTECPKYNFRLPRNVVSRYTAAVTGSKGEGGSIESNNENQIFFKFRKHYFIPMSLSNGNNFFYAFENPELLKHFYYMHSNFPLDSFEVASFSQVYSENILGISICKNVQIIPEGNTHQDFWQG